MRGGSTQGLTMHLAAIRSRLRNREISTRKQVGDAEGIFRGDESGGSGRESQL